MTDDALIPPPLDAYETLKPDEPGWTVQGGDPLGGPLLRIWAAFTRLRAGVITPGAVNTVFEEIRAAANRHPPENERERDGLLIRATRTEEVSWNMDVYLKGEAKFEEQLHEADDEPDALARIDLHDYRVRAVSKINNAVAELVEIDEELAKRDFDAGGMPIIDGIIAELKALSDAIEPRRIMKRA
jgi:hypothetical protein